MLDLIALEDIKPIREDIRCRGCLKFKVLIHASDVWQIENDKFVRIAPLVVDSCFFTNKICKGLLLREEDYETIDACTKYEECSEWEGVSKSFISLIQGLINYLIFTENKEYDKAVVMKIAMGLKQTTVVLPLLDEEEKNKHISEQFGVERMNYDLMEAVRSRVNDT